MSTGDAAAAASMDLDALASRYARGTIRPSELVAQVRARIEERGSDGVWISLAPLDALLEAARSVEARQRAGQPLPLYGVPFGVKDNIDVAALPTTAACPAFTYTPVVSARVVDRLVAAGAIVIGKTNLDQFATGLVGTRSPYGVPRNPFNRDFVTGGSSSGSAVAVALGQVSFTLGTDTAGSGRVPAAFNNIVGLKPSRGVLSTTGVVPACRSLDCVSVFAATCEDAARVADCARGFDPADPFSRSDAGAISFSPAATPRAFRFGVPRPVDRQFHGDTRAAAAFDEALHAWSRLGGMPVEVDMAPFFEAGALLYEGPFVAERLEAAGGLLCQRPESLIAPLRTILEGAARHQALAVFSAQSRLHLLRRRVDELWPTVDFLLLPTAPTIPTVADVERDPLRLNSALGLYTTFGNLLDLAALAVPAGFRTDGLPAGVTLLGPAGDDARLAGFGSRFQRASALKIGATIWPVPAAHPAPPVADAGPAGSSRGEITDEIALAVVGAHLSGQPLNHQLTSLGGRLLRACSTAAEYRLFALPNTTPPKPGLLKTSGAEGVAIELEVWALSPSAFGAFVARVPGPLCIGKIKLDDGSLVSGFLCEPHATVGARDISTFGGWRNFLDGAR